MSYDYGSGANQQAYANGAGQYQAPAQQNQQPWGQQPAQQNQPYGSQAVEPSSDFIVRNMICSSKKSTGAIDFRDELSAAGSDNYAAMHREKTGMDSETNTRKYASGIDIYMTDTQQKVRTDDGATRSLTLSARIDPTLPYEWLEVCKASIGSAAIPLRKRTSRNGGKYTMVPSELALYARDTQKGAQAFSVLLHKATEILSMMFNNGLNMSNGLLSVSGASVQNAAVVSDGTDIPSAFSYKRGVDYVYSQTRVHAHAPRGDGKVPVIILTVERSSFRANDGDESNYPWNIKIEKFYAAENKQSTGTVAYRPGTEDDKKSIYFRLSDRDMFRMMTRITHYIDAWEYANCVTVIRNGKAQYEAERSGARNNYNH